MPNPNETRKAGKHYPQCQR